MDFKIVFLALLLLNTVIVNAAPINKWVDSNGKTHYGTQPPEDAQPEIIKNAPPGDIHQGQLMSK